MDPFLAIPCNDIIACFSEVDNFELDDNDMNGVVEEAIDEAKKGVFANRFQFNSHFTTCNLHITTCKSYFHFQIVIYTLQLVSHILELAI